jgi:ParB family chromosome partitioning protein
MSNKRPEPYTIKKPVDLLFGSNATNTQPTQSRPNTIAITKIHLPSSQPRRYFDSEALEELSRSIKELGILEPLLVRPLNDDTYELVAGERRYRAASMAGLTEIPIVVREMDDATTYQVRLVENLQREDLNPLEETEGILELLALRLQLSLDDTIKLLQKMENEAKGKITRNVTGNAPALLVEEIFTALGRMRWDSFVRNRLPLLNLPHDVLEVLRTGRLEYTKARTIARIQVLEIRTKLLKVAIESNLSLSEIKQKIKEVEQSQLQSSCKGTPIVLKERVDNAFRRFKQAKLWTKPEKQNQIETLIEQLEALLTED